MSNTTLASWKSNIAIRLSATVPSLTVADGTTLASNYLSQTGGWLPDNPAAPTDLGRPASGATDDEVVQLLLTQIANSQYEFTATVSIPITLTVYSNLTPGLNTTQVRDAVSQQIRDYLNRLAVNLPIGINPSSLPFSTTSSAVVGTTTPSQRVAFQSSITQAHPHIIGTALTEARLMHTLNTTWNVASIYATSEGLTAIIRKYVDINYSALDSNVTKQVVVRINPDTGNVISGIKVDV